MIITRLWSLIMPSFGVHTKQQKDKIHTSEKYTYALFRSPKNYHSLVFSWSNICYFLWLYSDNLSSERLNKTDLVHQNRYKKITIHTFPGIEQLIDDSILCIFSVINNIFFLPCVESKRRKNWLNMKYSHLSSYSYDCGKK